MDEYRELVEILFRERSKEIFDNSSPDHAAVLMETMFRHGDRCIRIFSGCLSDDVYGRASLISEVKKFLFEKSGNLIIIIQDQIEQALIFNRKLLAEILADNTGSAVVSNGRLQVFLANPRHAKLDGHFSTMDGIAFRLETNKEKMEAVASANNAGSCVKLDGVFDMLLSTATKLPLVNQYPLPA